VQTQPGQLGILVLTLSEEDLEVGEFVEYRRDEDGRKAVSGIYNRQRELGRTFSVRKYEGVETNGTFQFPITITRITRIN
jgi:hypothetical protein